MADATTPRKGDRVYIDEVCNNALVTATDLRGFDWEQNGKAFSAGGWAPFVDSEGKTNWRILPSVIKP
jgi:hypothetical protein